jgi:hypothetical protein
MNQMMQEGGNVMIGQTHAFAVAVGLEEIKSRGQKDSKLAG